MSYLGGTTPSAGYSELFVPLLQDNTHLMYGDFQGLFNNQSALQCSFGGGVSPLIGDAVILGELTSYRKGAKVAKKSGQRNLTSRSSQPGGKLNRADTQLCSPASTRDARGI